MAKIKCGLHKIPQSVRATYWRLDETLNGTFNRTLSTTNYHCPSRQNATPGRIIAEVWTYPRVSPGTKIPRK